MTYEIKEEPVRVFEQDNIETNVGVYEYNELNRISRLISSAYSIMDEYENGHQIGIDLENITIKDSNGNIIKSWQTREHERDILKSTVDDLYHKF